jgi:hypothetical protein
LAISSVSTWYPVCVGYYRHSLDPADGVIGWKGATSPVGPERRVAAMQRYGRYRRKTGLITDDLDPALLTLAA